MSTDYRHHDDGEAMDAYSKAVSDVADRVGPAVVRIDTVGGRRPRQRGRQPRNRPGGTGSGVIFASDGKILTNEHVVRGAGELRVTLTDGRTFPAGLVSSEPASDLAVLRVGATSLPVAHLSSHQLRVGQLVVAIGNAYGLGWSVTAGVVSALGRSISSEGVTLSDLIQTDTPINPGNSGGPLIDTQGRVVGVAVAVMPYARGIGFAVPTSAALNMLARNQASRPVDDGRWIGIGGISTPIDDGIVRRNSLPRRQGILVLEVRPGSPAANASLKPMDIIVAIGGTPVATLEELRLAMGEYRIGQPVEVLFLRSYSQRRVTLLLESRASFATL